jgi:hypothetical protein
VKTPSQIKVKLTDHIGGINMATKNRIRGILVFVVFLFLSLPCLTQAWNDKTHLAIAKAAGYPRWYNAVGPDIAKIKAGDKEVRKHSSKNPPDTVITPQMILVQVAKYDDKRDEKGHLYGAIVASLRNYKSAKASGKYHEYYLAYCVHYVGDLSCLSIILSTIHSASGTIPPWMEP